MTIRIRRVVTSAWTLTHSLSMLEHYLVKPSNQAYQSQLRSVIKRHHVLSKLTARRIFELHIEQFNTAQMWALRNHATLTDHLNCWPVNSYCLLRRHIKGLVRLVTAQCQVVVSCYGMVVTTKRPLCYTIFDSLSDMKLPSLRWIWGIWLLAHTERKQ